MPSEPTRQNTAEKPARRTAQRTSLSVGCTAHVVQDGLSATVFVLLPILAQTFGLTYAQVGLYKGLKSLAQAFLEMSSGVVTERIGEARTLIFGLALSALGYSLLAFAPGAALVMACLLIIGAGTAFQHAPASALIIAAHPVDRRRGPLGLYNSSGDVGKLLFSGAFGLAIGAGLAWQTTSLGFGLVALAAAVAITFATRTLAAPPARSKSTDAPDDSDPAQRGWGILNWPAYGTLLVVVFLDTMIQTAAMVFIAFLMLAKGLPLVVATAATVILLAGGVLGKASCGYLADRIGVQRAFNVIQVLTAIGLAGVVWAPSWFALLLLLPVGAVTQGSTSITYGFAADLIHPKRMARGYALLYSMASLASAAGPLAFGLLADFYDIETAMFAMAAVALASAPLIAFLPSARKAAPHTA